MLKFPGFLNEETCNLQLQKILGWLELGNLGTYTGFNYIVCIIVDLLIDY